MQQRSEPPAHILAGLGLRPEIAKKANFMKGKGCTNCNKSGYRGRMGIYELMTMTTPDPRDDVQGRVHPGIRKMARKQGMHTLFEDGMIKALKGLTTLDEVLADHPAATCSPSGRHEVTPERAVGVTRSTLAPSVHAASCPRPVNARGP